MTNPVAQKLTTLLSGVQNDFVKIVMDKASFDTIRPHTRNVSGVYRFQGHDIIPLTAPNGVTILKIAHRRWHDLQWTYVS